MGKRYDFFDMMRDIILFCLLFSTCSDVNDIKNWKDKIDVIILCGGSATDLPVQSPESRIPEN